MSRQRVFGSLSAKEGKPETLWALPLGTMSKPQAKLAGLIVKIYSQESISWAVLPAAFTSSHYTAVVPGQAAGESRTVSCCITWPAHTVFGDKH